MRPWYLAAFVFLTSAVAYNVASAATINAGPGGVANQSSTGSGGVASRGIDGNTNGNYNSGSVTHTNSTAIGNWWEVTLGPTSTGMELQNLTIFGRGDCCQNRAQNFTVQVFDSSNNLLHTANYVNPAGIPAVATAQSYPAQGVQFVVPSGIYNAARVRVTSNHADYLSLAEVQVNVNNANIEVGGDNIIGSTTMGSGTLVGGLANARLIRVVQNKAGAALSLTELQAFEDITGTNVALQSNGGVATQTSSPYVTNYLAPLAIDGSLTNFTHTADAAAPGSESWQVTLSADTTLDRIRIYDRFDCCGAQNRTENIQLQIFSDTAGTNMIYDEQILGLTQGTFRDINLSAENVVTLDPAGIYTFELNGDTLASDLLIVPLDGADQSHLVADGTLNIELLAGVLDPGDTFQLFDADIFSGSFDQINLPSGYRFDLSNLLVNGTITVAPEPATLALWIGLFGAAAVVGWRRKAQRA